jgi:predicted 2-oxoglutarate/Fe(II)-dependent dioxygenase YbiX
LRKYHGFVVNYDPKKQGSLDLHEDSSAVTLNACLGRGFTGGKLVFRDDGGKILARVEHKVGQAVLHLGEQQHEAQNIRSGQRSNLILWCSE